MKNMNMNTNANNTTSLTNTSHLSSLEYAGLESLFQRIIDTYEAEYLGIEPCSHTPVSQITKRTSDGILVLDGSFDLYPIKNFAVKGLYAIGDCCILSAFRMDSEPEECFDHETDLFIDITKFLDEHTVDMDYLLDKLEKAEREF